MNQELVTYIQKAQAQGKAPDAIKHDLVSNGWLEQDIQAAFDEVGMAPVAPMADTARQKRAIYAKVSAVLLPVAVISFFIHPILSVIAVLAGIVCGLIGIRSTHAWLAVLSTMTHVLLCVFLGYVFYTVYTAIRYGEWPNGEPLTEQELQEFGIDKGDQLQPETGAMIDRSTLNAGVYYLLGE